MTVYSCICCLILLESKLTNNSILVIPTYLMLVFDVIPNMRVISVSIELDDKIVSID